MLFVVLEVVALSHYARSNAYTQARLLSRSNQVVGGMQGAFTRVRHFCSLGSENRRLTERIVELEQELSLYREEMNSEQQRIIAQRASELPYYYKRARASSASIERSQNFIVIDKGARDGVGFDMALLSANGAMAGYIISINKNYSVAMSILHPAFQASGKLQNSPEYYGSVRGDGTDSRYVMMYELSKYADIHEGDKVVSTGFSDYFPPEIPIGEVESFELNETGTYYTVKVRLAADMRSLSNVILARSADYEELKGLEFKLKKRYQ